MLRLIFALVGSIGLVLLIMPRVLPVLHRLKFGQTIYDLVPERHKAKQGTPTMGGLVFAATTTLVAMGLHGTWFGKADFGLAVVVFSLLSMMVGFVDDYIKVVRKRNLGLVWWQKVVGQLLLGGLFSLYCFLHPQIGSAIVVPFLHIEWQLGVWYIPLMTLVSMFMINSANLQDGLDGLLSSVATVGASAWALLALLLTMGVGLLPGAVAPDGNYLNVTVFALALVGSLIGFLRFNFYPAKVFMGDTGSMFIGGATVALSMVLRSPLLMILIAFTMIMSSVSVILQRIYFKLTHGKRIFKMSPIHHHFELSGMNEPQIVAMYAIITGVLSMVAVLSLVVLA